MFIADSGDTFVHEHIYQFKKREKVVLQALRLAQIVVFFCLILFLVTGFFVITLLENVRSSATESQDCDRNSLSLATSRDLRRKSLWTRSMSEWVVGGLNCSKYANLIDSGLCQLIKVDDENCSYDCNEGQVMRLYFCGMFALLPFAASTLGIGFSSDTFLLMDLEDRLTYDLIFYLITTPVVVMLRLLVNIDPIGTAPVFLLKVWGFQNALYWHGFIATAFLLNSITFMNLYMTFFVSNLTSMGLVWAEL